MEVEAACPYRAALSRSRRGVDAGGGRSQRYLEDCSVCWRAITVHASTDENGEAAIALRGLDE